MRAGKLSEFISIYRPDIKKSEYGKSNNINFIPYIASTRAQVINNKGTRVIDNNEVYYSYIVTFVIRGYHIIDEYMRIKYKGRFYRILNIIPSTNEKFEISIDAELVNE